MSAPEPTGPDADLGERFVSSLAHELRSPLTVVLGYAELLRRRGDEGLRTEAAERILQAVERLSHGIDDLVTVFAIERDHLAVDVRAVELEPAVRESVLRVEGLYAGRSIRVNAPDAWPLVYGDEEHLGRLLVDLLRVASTRSSDGAQVEVTVSTAGGSASIAVSAEWGGLAQEQLAAMFERPPTRVPVTRGTGLELYKARRLVELQGGSIAATSSGRAPPTVTITLPVADPAEPE